jgi:TonB family protein
MRTSILLASLLAAAPLGAQRVTGVAVDSSTDVPLRCVDVTLQDTTGRVIARALTAADGSFGLEAPSPGPHELQFTVWRRAPAMRAIQSMDGSSEKPPRYALFFGSEPGQPVILWPDTVDSPPGRPRKLPQFGSLAQLARQGVAAIAVVRYAVDATGRVDRSSIQVLESSHKTWERSVVGFLRNVEYEPARRNGQPVCALEYGTPFNFNAHP